MVVPFETGHFVEQEHALQSGLIIDRRPAIEILVDDAAEITRIARITRTARSRAKGRQHTSGNHLRGNRSALAGLEPADSEIVPPTAFFVQHFDIIGLACGQRNWDGFLGAVFIPLQRAGPTGGMGDALFLGRILSGAQPQFAAVIATDPEGVVPALGGHDIPTNTLTIIVRPIGCLRGIAPVHRAQAVEGVGARGTAREIRMGGEIAHSGSADSGPILAGDRTCLHSASMPSTRCGHCRRIVSDIKRDKVIIAMPGDAGWKNTVEKFSQNSIANLMNPFPVSAEHKVRADVADIGIVIEHIRSLGGVLTREIDIAS